MAAKLRRSPANLPAKDGYYHKYFTYNGHRYHIATHTTEDVIQDAAEKIKAHAGM